MSVLAYPPTTNEEFRRCTKQCGIVMSTEDQQYFALECVLCTERFLYLNAFIEHIRRKHASRPTSNEVRPNKRRHDDGEVNESLTGGHPPMPETSTVVIKEEKCYLDEDNPDDAACIKNEPLVNNDFDGYYGGQNDTNLSMTAEDSSYMADTSYAAESNASYNDDYEDDGETGGDDTNYDDMVEESLLNSSPIPGVTNHIKDRKMIVFLIEAFRRNSFLWNPDHPQFRDRIKRNQFLKWMHDEFKRRYNLTLARDAITRKWENLRTVYKRECTRMALENTNISTLWYFKELYFLNHLYGGKQENMETVVQGAASRKRMFAIWNDVSTNKLIELLRVYACFYDRNHADYGNKDKKAEAFQQMANELAPIIEVTPIQISKRIAQLRYDYAKQKQERIRCEITGNIFTPNYSYYDQLLFMDSDIAPFKCDLCVSVLRSTQELDAHMMSHKQQNSQFSNISSSSSINPSGNSINDFNGGSNYFCPVCELCFNDLEQLNRHKQIHPQFREVRYQCDLCTASFRDKTIYDEHIRRHNDELLLPDLNLLPPIDNNAEIITGENSPYFSPADDSHSSSPKYKCNYAGCHREFTTRSNMVVHSKTHCSDEQFGCDVCGKVFRTSKNLQNHKQIHSAIKKYVCKICGSAFAQAAGLYLHKRRHNRQM
uniref:Zinc finger, C2H2 type n=1 Tax=Musca domestica TaxID=7370 RepID=A0A1I8M6D8_MUSDO